MASNYWESTQKKHWFFTKDALAECRYETEKENAKIIEQHPLPDRRLMFIFIKDKIQQLGKRLTFRQQCIATALVYIQRYLLSTLLQNVNLYLLVATAFYLASKTEESPHNIRTVASEARQVWPEYMNGDVARIGEMEFSLISEMRSQLIIWHPYRTLEELKEDAELNLTAEEYNLAWSVINDSYMTDLPLTCDPHTIAMVAVFLAILFQSTKQNTVSQATSFHGEGNVSFSIGGRPGLANAMNNAMSHVSSSQPTSHPSSQASAVESGTDGGNISANLGPTATAFASEKVQRFVTFLVESELELEDMIEATQEIISLYEIWEQYNEKNIKDAVARYLKGRGLDS
jgi:cyclin-C